jgi:hypothetical protein
VGCSDLNTAVEGYDYNNVRWVPQVDGYGANERRPMRDTDGEECSQRFGSAHGSVFHVAFCDGSIHPLNFGIDLQTLSRLGVRNDMLPIRPEDF